MLLQNPNNKIGYILVLPFKKTWYKIKLEICQNRENYSRFIKAHMKRNLSKFREGKLPEFVHWVCIKINSQVLGTKIIK